MVTLNEGQRLYVIPCGTNGYTCLGVDQAQERHLALSNWWHRQTGHIVNVPFHGTVEAYEELRQ